MSAREDVLRVLLSSEAARIRFSFLSIYGTRIAVDNTTFMRVAQAIESGFVVISETGVSPNSGGQYDNTREIGGIFYTRPVRNSRRRRSVFIHEAVHASFDLTRSVAATVDNEAASFLAQFLYLRFISFPIAEILTRNPTESRLYEVVWRAVGSVTRGGSVSGSLMQQIRDRICELPDYSYARTEGCFNGEGDCFYTITGANG